MCALAVPPPSSPDTVERFQAPTQKPQQPPSPSVSTGLQPVAHKPPKLQHC